ncbi:unnamed protein product, partial [Rotaria sp. Silwood1]
CRDWYYAGNNWNYILTYENWSVEERNRYWSDGGEYTRWQRRNGATCTDPGMDGDGRHIHFLVCVCPDNNRE